MPNDCYNIVEISHDDPDTVKRLVECLEKEPPEFFAAFVPCHKSENCVSYWGTKWDVYDVSIDEKSDDNTINVSFSTAWSPPMRAYSQLQKLGFTINAKFMESGGDFCGYWNDGEEIIYENVVDNIKDVPEEFHFYFQVDEEEEEIV